jgi:hypothetical protein
VTGAENTILVTRIPVSEPRLTATDRVVPTNAEAIGVGFGTASEKELPVSLPAHAKDRKTARPNLSLHSKQLWPSMRDDTSGVLVKLLHKGPQ